MNKQESQNLMIGSWVLAEGKPRQVHSLTTKKAGFKRGTNGQRDFFRFDQLQGIPLSEPLLKECVTYRPTGKQQDTDPAISIHCYSDTVIAVRIDGNTQYYRFRYLHEVQSFLLSTYQLQVQFDVEKYNWLRQPEMMVSREELMRLAAHTSIDIEKLKANAVSGDNILKRMVAFRTQDGHSLVCDHIPTPDLGKDKRGFQYGSLTYKK